MSTVLKAGVNILLFVVFVLFIIIGHKDQTLRHLFLMLIGLSGLIGLLWNYNRVHK